VVTIGDESLLCNVVDAAKQPYKKSHQKVNWFVDEEKNAKNNVNNKLINICLNCKLAK